MAEQKKAGIAVGEGIQVIIGFVKKQAAIFRSLADRPGHHEEVRKFALSLLELERFTGFSLTDFSTDKAELEQMVADGFNASIAAMSREISDLYAREMEDEATDKNTKRDALASEANKALKMFEAPAPPLGMEEVYGSLNA